MRRQPDSGSYSLQCTRVKAHEHKMHDCQCDQLQSSHLSRETAEQWDQDMPVVHKMHEASMTADVISFRLVISRCEESQALGASIDFTWEQALMLLHRMRESGMITDVITFSVAISACEKGEQWEQASAPLHKMRETDMTAYMISYSAISASEKRRQWVSAAI